jgi:hypothetical protein
VKLRLKRRGPRVAFVDQILRLDGAALDHANGVEETSTGLVSIHV